MELKLGIIDTGSGQGSVVSIEGKWYARAHMQIVNPPTPRTYYFK